ncbi:MAG: DUF2520 domain-containing protein [Bifidobacteriaceae bacterium]|nr:DUF2520 domain-containing protein [Bifidobacteriaceae bacterium]
MDLLAAGVIGLGRVGTALVGALAAVDHPIAAVTARSRASREVAALRLPRVPVVSAAEVARRAGLVFLTVPDAVIPKLAAELADHWRPGQIVVHTAGALGLDVLEPASRAGAITLAIHPVMTFNGSSNDVAAMCGVPFAVEAGPGLLPLAEALAIELGGSPFPLPPGSRALYHAALAHASNHLVTLIAQATELLESIGLANPGELIRPLAQASLAGALDIGIEALTGPASRGDVSTLAAHVAALQADGNGATNRLADPDAQKMVDSYLTMARATVRAASVAGRISPDQADQALAVLGADQAVGALGTDQVDGADQAVDADQAGGALGADQADGAAE